MEIKEYLKINKGRSFDLPFFDDENCGKIIASSINRHNRRDVQNPDEKLLLPPTALKKLLI